MNWTRAQLIKMRRNIHLAAVSLNDEQALESIELFPAWASGSTYQHGDRIRYDGILYRCVQGHTSQSDWTPDATPALWTVISLDEWPEWRQPTGAHDAYGMGDRVSHNDRHWVSTMNANSYEPGVYGWEEQ